MSVGKVLVEVVPEGGNIIINNDIMAIPAYPHCSVATTLMRNYESTNWDLTLKFRYQYVSHSILHFERKCEDS